MRLLGSFDPTAIPHAWFDPTVKPGGWFDDSLIDAPVGSNLFYVIGPAAGWADPTETEIVSGVLAGGGPSTASNYETAPTVSTSPFDFAQIVSGLSTGTYKIAFLWWNGLLPYAAPNVSNISVGSFTLSSSTFPALCLIGGVLQQNPAATGTDIKVYLTATGLLEAKTAAGGGDRLVNLVAGNLVAA